MVQFQKATLKNLKNWETFSYLGNFKFLKVVWIEFRLKVKFIWNKIFLLKEFITKKFGRQNVPLPFGAKKRINRIYYKMYLNIIYLNKIYLNKN